MTVTVGDTAPPIPMPDQHRTQWTLEDHRGSPVVGVLRSSGVVDVAGVVAAVFDTIRPQQQSAKALEVVRSL